MAPAGARNCLLPAHVRMLRGFLRLGGVRVDLAAIGPLAACVRFGIFSATCCTRHRSSGTVLLLECRNVGRLNSHLRRLLEGIGHLYERRFGEGKAHKRHPDG